MVLSRLESGRWQRVLLGLAVVTLVGCGPTPFTPDPIGPTDGWQLFHPLPVGYDLEAVWAASPRNVWAVGAHGVIVHWDGATVRRVDSPTTVDLIAVSGRSRDDIYAIGREFLLHFDGRTWEVARRFTEAELFGVLCRADGTLVVVGTMGTWIRSGGAWSPIPRLTGVCDAVWEPADGSVRIGEGQRIWRLDDDGPVVELDADDHIFSMANGRFACGERSSSLQDVYQLGPGGTWAPPILRISGMRALADIGGLVVATNGGIEEAVSWRRLWRNADGRWINGLFVGADGTLYACGHGGTLIAGRREGEEYTWNETAQTIGFRYFNDLDGTGFENIWAAEWYGRVLHFDGSSWHLENAPVAGSSVAQIQAVTDTVVFALGGGVLARRDERGDWSRLDETEYGIETFCAVSPDSLYACMNERQFLLWHDGLWQALNQADRPVAAIAATADGAVYALTGGGTSRLWHAGDAGFTPAVELPGMIATHLHGSRSSGAVYIAGWSLPPQYRGLVYRYQDGRLEDLTAGVDLPDDVRDLTEPRPGLLFVATGGQVWRWQDGVWNREAGLPGDEQFKVLWSHRDCGIFAHGHATFFKPLGLN